MKKEFKRVTGSKDLQSGDVIVLTDDDGMDRFFTIRKTCWEQGNTIGYMFGGSPDRDLGVTWYKGAHDFTYIVKEPLTTEEKLAKVVDALRLESRHSGAARLILESIGRGKMTAGFVFFCCSVVVGLILIGSSLSLTNSPPPCHHYVTRSSGQVITLDVNGHIYRDVGCVK